MVTIFLKDKEVIRDIETYDIWEKDNNFFILKDVDGDNVILSKDVVFRINEY